LGASVILPMASTHLNPALRLKNGTIAKMKLFNDRLALWHISCLKYPKKYVSFVNGVILTKQKH